MKVTELPKGEMEIKFEGWLASDEGVACSCTHYLITTSKYDQLMRQNLQAAFLAGAVADNEVQQEIADKALGKIENIIGTNTGHGHVWARPDGIKMRCGGPGICTECSQDADKRISQTDVEDL